ncbi:MAG: S1 RNA-binding domain-containing protein [Clostridia bacterium]|nr:S1 RNA-binding domain-containing protein [Clostridia bacterium]
MNNRYLPEGELIRDYENRECLSSFRALERAHEKRKILESFALLSDGDFNLHFDLGGVSGIMPREEVVWSPAGDPVKDVAILTRVGKPVCFMITGFRRGEDGEPVAILSRRLAQEECHREYVSALTQGDVIPAAVTHLECFGAFCDVGCGIVSLLSIDSISVSRISHPRVRFAPGDRVPVVVKNIDADGRIFVSQRELYGTWEENAALFTTGETVTGIVRSVENYGVFVELTPNLAGLAEPKEGVAVDRSVAVFIKSIIPEKMKVKLIIIDAGHEAFGRDALPHRPPRYFTDPKRVSHIDAWRYSPAVCPRVIETSFA